MAHGLGSYEHQGDNHMNPVLFIWLSPGVHRSIGSRTIVAEAVESSNFNLNLNDGVLVSALIPLSRD